MNQEERLRRAGVVVREVRSYLARCVELGRPHDQEGEDRAWSEFIAHAIQKAIDCEHQRRKRAGASP